MIVYLLTFHHFPVVVPTECSGLPSPSGGDALIRSSKDKLVARKLHIQDWIQDWICTVGMGQLTTGVRRVLPDLAHCIFRQSICENLVTWRGSKHESVGRSATTKQSRRSRSRRQRGSSYIARQTEASHAGLAWPGMQDGRGQLRKRGSNPRLMTFGRILQG